MKELKRKLTVAGKAQAKAGTERDEAKLRAKKATSAAGSARTGPKSKSAPPPTRTGGLGGLSDALGGGGKKSTTGGAREQEPPGAPGGSSKEAAKSDKGRRKSQPPKRVAMKANSTGDPTDDTMVAIPGFRRSDGSKDNSQAGVGEWIRLGSGSSRVRSAQLEAGDTIEVALANSEGDGWGSRVLFRLRAVDEPDSGGQVAAAEFGGTNEDEDRFVEALQDAFPNITAEGRSQVGGDVAKPSDGGDRPETLLHFCARGSDTCRAKFGDLDIHHVEMFRKLDLSRGAPDWILPDFDEVTPAADEAAAASDEDERLEDAVPKWAIRDKAKSHRSSPRPRERGRKRSKDSGRRSRRKRRSSSPSRCSSRSSSNSRNRQLFRGAPGDQNRIRLVARRAPGKIFQEGMKAIAEQLGGRQGSVGIPSVRQYILLVVNNLVPPAKQGRRNREELLMLASSLDVLGKDGDKTQSFDSAKARTGDQLMQRFKMLESAILDGNWEIANSMSLLDEEQKGLATREEREESLKNTLKEAKFLEAREKVAAASKRMEKDKDREDR